MSRHPFVLFGLLSLCVAAAVNHTRAERSGTHGAEKTLQAPSTPATQAAPRQRTPEEIAAREKERSERRARGAELYAKYCTECHGRNGEGHLADNANSLRSRSFLATVSNAFIDNAVRYGRPGTAMAAYHESLGGPLTEADMGPLAFYIMTIADVKRADPGKPGAGDAERGKRIYRARCESCHGPTGKGPTAPSLHDPLFLLTASQPFLRYAVTEGRDGTAMPAFRDSLNAQEIEDVTAHVTSWSRRWIQPGAVRLKSTSLTDAVLNPNGQQATLGPLKDDLFVGAVELKKALDRGSRIVLLDTRAPSAWAVRHIPGAVPLPYFDAEQKASELPNDGTWIVAYCECPIALSKRVITTLRTKGFKNTAVLEEGLAGWVYRRFPLASGIVENVSQ
jgi:cbb3-type cytochrome c oxidase subunit III